MSYKILVGSYTDRITTLAFDPDRKTLQVLSTVQAGQSPSWIAQHPTDKSLIFATNEVEDGKIQLFRLAKDGRLTFLEECSSGGALPANLGVSEDAVVVANYMGSSILEVPLSATSPYLQQRRQDPITFEGKGPNKSRQESSHPHQVILRHGTQKEILVPDLGADKIWRLTEGDGGKWSVAGSIDFVPGSGPRHAVIHDNIIYTALELTNEVASHIFTERPGKSIPLGSLSSLPQGAKPENLLAEILISDSTPLHPIPLLYVSNRNEGPPGGDSIAIFTLHQHTLLYEFDGESQFKLVNSVATGLHHLRGMSIGGNDGRYIIAGGVNGGGIKVFERVGKSLSVVASTEAVVKPTSFLWV
ncbi:putative isomerase YbhE [Cantharellus anzutake]|uniref:putative isomerase YbhE n=1 Tax=Cantharellus anzutake TaxID=1750568 RepID=UPI0019079211|nr:putative isomerase YbhE [Cantharellus anzutake]KAF8342588.1 putative isomerase YbhE [Cantharellus anzutake]